MSPSLSLFQQAMLQVVPQEGITPSHLKDVGIFKASAPHDGVPALYEPMICLMGQGKKQCCVGDESFCYQSGDFFINFLPLPVSTQVMSASQEQPLLTVGIGINRVRLADLMVRIEQADPTFFPQEQSEEACVVVGQANDELIQLFTKLVRVAFSPQESAILGASVIDEIYYRVLTSEHGYALRLLLHRYGQIQPISKAISYIHNNMERAIPIEELASIANMSKSSFFAAFKKLMHMPPLQYIKSTKLQTAQSLLKQGMRANEASYKVGYNNFSQFSREYKRLYGFTPSETRHMMSA